MNKKYFYVIVILILLSPIGLLADGTAWGEWGSDELKEALGFVPAGIESAEHWRQVIFPDYSLPLWGDGKVSQAVAYILAAVIGSALVYGLTLILTKTMLSRRAKERP